VRFSNRCRASFADATGIPRVDIESYNVLVIEVVSADPLSLGIRIHHEILSAGMILRSH
jgi:hypothetical protein